MVDERCKASPRHQKVYQDTRVCKSHKQVNRAIGYVPGVRGVINHVSDGKRHRKGSIGRAKGYSIVREHLQGQEPTVNLKVVMEPSEDGGFTVIVPSLPGCIAEGDSKDEALKNIREAIELYLEPVEDDISFVPGTEVTEIAV
jgi:predicted RNase H-like HicB family nuclease